MTWLWVAVGSAIGGVGRDWCVGLTARFAGETFPWGTLLVNVVGSFAIALFAGLAVADGRFTVPPEVRQFVAVGLLGGFTTFSSFSLQTLDLLRAGEGWRAGAYVVASLACCLLGAGLGYLAAEPLGR